MPFLDHLEELRWRLLKALAALVLGAVICFFLKEKLLDFLTYPYYDAVESLQGDRSAGSVEAIRQFFQKWFPEIATTQPPEAIPTDANTVPRLQAIKPMTFFFVYLQISFFGGLVLSLPVISYQLWRFIAPGMLPGEKRLVLPIATFSVLCFAIGALIAYWLVLPLGVRFFLALEPEGMISQWDIGAYIGLAVRLLLGFGLVFELPVLAFFLTRIGLVTPQYLRQVRSYAIVAIFVLGALLTPPDPISQVMMALPLIILYQISILVSRLSVPKAAAKTND